jgi:glycosyltransferase involved in cell wall biosynthesis
VDNLPLVLPESMACCMPMASFAVGGVPDLVRDDETGFAVPPGTVEKFARLTTRLSDTPRRARKERRCREPAKAEYSLELRAKRYLKLFGEISTPLWLEPLRAN